MTEPTSQDHIDDPYANLEADAMGAMRIKKPKTNTSPYDFIIIVNKDLTGETQYGVENVGKFYNRSKKSFIDSILATILYVCPIRELGKMVDGKWTKSCCSFDGEHPAFRIENPKCEEATEDQVLVTLGKMKFDKAQLPDLAKRVTHETKEGASRVLGQCALMSLNGRLYDLCPMTNRDLKTTCKQGLSLYGYNHDTSTLFRMDIYGPGIRNDSKYVSPLSEFQLMCSEQKHPMFGYITTLTTTAGAKGNFLLDCNHKEAQKITNLDQAKVMRKFFDEAKEYHMRKQMWKPKPKDEASTSENTDS